MKILFLRHGLTSGNLEKRYIGRTDEPLCAKGISELQKLVIPKCSILISSPMKRCIQTSELLFPNKEIVIEKNFRECDFGDFEGKNYVELSENSDYQKWIDSGGNLPFPNGEDTNDFRRRNIEAFEKIMQKIKNEDSAAFIVHGGTIMSVLEKYAVPHKAYFDWHCENGHGYICEWNGTELEILEKI